MGKQKAKGNDSKRKKKEDAFDRICAANYTTKTMDIFHYMYLDTVFVSSRELGKNTPAAVNNKGNIMVNRDIWLTKSEWIYILTHCQLHLAFGHYDIKKVPGYWKEDTTGKKIKIPKYNKKIWNVACDIYVTKFLLNAKIGTPTTCTDVSQFPESVISDEIKLYEYLIENGWPEDDQRYGVGADNGMDMFDADRPVPYGDGDDEQEWSLEFADSLAYAASKSVTVAGGHDYYSWSFDAGTEAAQWFILHYPLLGALAASLKIIRDEDYCLRNDIQIAAINVDAGEIYLNPSKYFNNEEWRFILAHEYLHAGLDHAGRRQGRDPQLWNIACDYCINGWLLEMEVGKMPEGVLYDAAFKDMSSEAIYDLILENIKYYSKQSTFRGNGKGDVITNMPGKFRKIHGLPDDFYKNALRQGLECEEQKGRGYIPAGLVDEIRAISVPPIPWDVALAEWFQLRINPLNRYRSYAHPSRRQSVTPYIPRPRYCHREDSGRTFGVVIDTSGSVTNKDIGIALGAVSSYAEANDVPLVRVVFCDAFAYDIGYVTPEDLAGTVKVTGRGGTILQPAVDLLEKAVDFPDNGPILIITDGLIESNLHVKRDHAFLLPEGQHLPFRPRGEVFYYRNDK